MSNLKQRDLLDFVGKLSLDASADLDITRQEAAHIAVIAVGWTAQRLMECESEADVKAFLEQVGIALHAQADSLNPEVQH